MNDDNLIVFPSAYEPPTPKAKVNQVDAADVAQMFNFLADEMLTLSKALQSLVNQLKRK